MLLSKPQSENPTVMGGGGYGYSPFGADYSANSDFPANRDGGTSYNFASPDFGSFFTEALEAQPLNVSKKEAAAPTAAERELGMSLLPEFRNLSPADAKKAISASKSNESSGGYAPSGGGGGSYTPSPLKSNVPHPLPNQSVAPVYVPSPIKKSMAGAPSGSYSGQLRIVR